MSTFSETAYGAVSSMCKDKTEWAAWVYLGLSELGPSCFTYFSARIQPLIRTMYWFNDIAILREVTRHET